MPGTELLRQAFEMELITYSEVENIKDGNGSDFYRESSKVDDPKKFKVYKAYETYFKLIQAFPKSWVSKLNIETLKSAPVWICSAISFIVDIISGLVKKNPDHIGYAKYYLFHIYRFVLIKTGIKPPKATNVVNDAWPNYLIKQKGFNEKTQCAN